MQQAYGIYLTHNGTAYIMFEDKLRAFYNGNLIWEFDHGGVSEGYLAPIVDNDGIIYIGTKNGLFVINPDGTLKWNKTTDSITSSIAIGKDGTIYFIDNKKIYALNKPQANFTITIEKLKVEFNDNSKGNNFEYYWDFGDGTTSTEYNPTHRYKDYGTYTITLKIKNQEFEDTIQKTINLKEILPPTIKSNIPSGKYNSAINIKFTSDSETNVMYYTINGGEPIIGINKYSGQTINLNKTTTIKIIAIDIYNNTSPVYTYIFNIELPKNNTTKKTQQKYINQI